MPSANFDPNSTATPMVSVVGTAVVRAEPDEAMLVVTLSALKDGPGAALEDVARRSEMLVALLDGFGIGSSDRSTTGVSVHEDFDHTPEGRRSLGHRAASAIAVRLTDLELIGRLVTRATTELDARIDGPGGKSRRRTRSGLRRRARPPQTADAKRRPTRRASARASAL